MKKPSFIIGKKQIILSGMTLILGVSIYMNYMFTDSHKILEQTKTVSGKSINLSTDSDAKSGDAVDVNAVPTGSQDENYFSQARLDRMTSRDEAVQTLQNIFNGGDTTKDEQNVAKQTAEQLSQNIELEAEIETLIKACGYKDCIVYLGENKANIVVQSGNADGLLASDVATITQVLLQKVDIPKENISVFDVTDVD